MPREYQLKTSGNALPHNVHMQVIYIIRDYPRLVREYEKILHSTPFNDGQPRGGGVGNPTEHKALRLAVISDQVEAVGGVVHVLNTHYARKIKRGDVDGFDAVDAFEDYGYFAYALYDPAKDRQPAYRTWQRFRREFLYEVAKKLNLI